ncbi:MAG: hypothetical protein U9N77_05370 [Thermodesulfobacteriota bacterium]|nr:hypothetical protein [Thermodesulfobacteriota bacterium]
MNFVQWLIDNRYLTNTETPVPIKRGGSKFFINSKAEHGEVRDAKWKKVGDFFVDVKYRAEDHVQNIRKTLRHLNIQDLESAIKIQI